MNSPEPKCRICGAGLRTGLLYMPDPLLPGDIPGRAEVCARCVERDGPFPDEPYVPPWAAWLGNQ